MAVTGPLCGSRHLVPRHFQISVPLQPGNSGGALVDERGNVIGIVSATPGTVNAPCRGLTGSRRLGGGVDIETESGKR